MSRRSLFVSLLAMLLVGVFATLALAAPKEKSVLLVCIVEPSEADTMVKDRLEASGYSVTLVDHTAVADENPDKYGLVVVSSSVTSSNVAGAPQYLNTTAGVLSWENALMDDFKFTMQFGPLEASPTDFEITAPTHPIAAGFTGKVSIYTENNQLHTGIRECGTAVAMIDGTDKVGILAIEKGEKLCDGTLAAGRRVHFASGDICFTNATDAGWKLFDQSVKWAIGK